MFNCWVGDWCVRAWQFLGAVGAVAIGAGAVVGLVAIGAGGVWVGAINRGDVTSNILGIKSFERYLQIPRDM